MKLFKKIKELAINIKRVKRSVKKFVFRSKLAKNIQEKRKIRILQNLWTKLTLRVSN